MAWIHYTVKNTCEGAQWWADPTHLRGNHYYLRSIEEGIAKSLCVHPHRTVQFCFAVTCVFVVCMCFVIYSLVQSAR